MIFNQRITFGLQATVFESQIHDCWFKLLSNILINFDLSKDKMEVKILFYLESRIIVGVTGRVESDVSH